MSPNLGPILKAAAVMGLFSVAGVGLVAWAHHETAARIADNQRQNLLQALQTLLPAGSYDNDPVGDAVEANDPLLGPRPMPVYRARKAGRPVALVMACVAPDGYNGEIRLLAGVGTDGALVGARVLEHRETPGLGDPVDQNKSRWIFGFDGLSLGNPPEASWKVRRDGGAFDQFAGATVTPRAVVKAIRNALRFFQANGNRVFSEPSQGSVDSPLDDD